MKILAFSVALFPLLVTAQQSDPSFGVFAEAGGFQTVGDDLDDSLFYGLGFRWRPSTKVAYEAVVNWQEHDGNASTSGVSSFDVIRTRLGVKLSALDKLFAGAGLVYLDVDETRQPFSCPGPCTDLNFATNGTGFYLEAEAQLNRYISALGGYTTTSLDQRLDEIRGSYLGLRVIYGFGKR